MRKRVYVETTIPSFYFEPRLEPEFVVQRTWTKDWWDNQRRHYELVTSAPVIEELEEGDYPQKADALHLISQLPLLRVDDRVSEVVDIYVQRHVMPRDPRGDAMHLALASCYSCHFLLTWNCTHLANANKFEHIRHVNTILGLFVPALVTPMELSAWREE